MRSKRHFPKITAQQDLLSIAANEILRNAKWSAEMRGRRTGRNPGKSNSPFIDHSQGVHVFADGACEPNPGPGGWAFVVIIDGEEVHTATGAAPASTNNRMELAAVIAALEWISKNAAGRPIAMYSDSRYVVEGSNAWRHGWKRKSWMRHRKFIPNVDLWRELDSALTARPQALTWVKGHSGILGNVRADQLASDALATWQRARRAAA